VHHTDTRDHKQNPPLRVGDRIPLPGVKRLRMGLGWDFKSKGSVDLDASCVLFDHAGQFITSVYFGNLSTADCAALQHKPCVVHSGDSIDGAVLISFFTWPRLFFIVAFLFPVYVERAMERMSTSQCCSIRCQQLSKLWCLASRPTAVIISMGSRYVGWLLPASVSDCQAHVLYLVTERLISSVRPHVRLQIRHRTGI
jgi:hypothetical protein